MTLTALIPSAAAYYVEPSIKETLGSDAYYGTYDYVEAGSDNFFLTPSFSSYHSRISSGTLNTYGLDAGYRIGEYMWSVNGGFTPTVNDYNNYSVGGKVERYFDLGEKTFVRGVDLSGGVLQTVHGEHVTSPALRAGAFSVPGSTGTIHIQQFDAVGYASVRLPDATVSLSLSKSVYDRDVARLAVRSASVTKLAGLNATVQGFPDNNVLIKIRWDAWKHAAPYVSYSYTSFKAQQPIAATYTAGSRFKWSGLDVDASYQLYAQKGAADLNYYSLGASYRFEAGD